MDERLQELARAVRAGASVVEGERFVREIQRAKGNPVARLQALLKRTNAKCRESSTSGFTTYNGRRYRVASYTVPWAMLQARVRVAVWRRRTYATWCVGPYGPLGSAARDATFVFVLADRERGIVTVGIGIGDCMNEKPGHAWPVLSRMGKTWWPRAYEWALDFERDDRVLLTFEQARQLAGPMPKRKRRRRDGVGRHG